MKNFDFHVAQRRVNGFSLIELMVAMAIGLVGTIGIVSLFGGTSRSNRMQEGLARMQESGRYASMRIESDLRMASAQYCSNSSGNRHVNTVAPMWQDRAPFVFAADLNLPDSGGMKSVDNLGDPSTTAATAAYGLSSRFFMQGYSCTTGTTCTPALWAPTMFPAAGLGNGLRVPNSDIVTVRYLRGTGWPITSSNACATGNTITVSPQTGDDPLNFPTTTPSLALLSDCSGPAVLPIASVSGNTLTLGNTLPDADGAPCSVRPERERRLFNFSRDFVTVTYYLAFRANDNPDARANTPNGALTPVLVRRENGVEQDLVRGVDQLQFRYGVRDDLGNMRFLTATQVGNRLGGAIACPPKPDGVAPNPDVPTVAEPGCLWRSVRRIEAYLLVSSGEEVRDLDTIARSFSFMGSNYSLAETATLPSGVSVHSYPRRQFIAHATHRNKTP